MTSKSLYMLVSPLPKVVATVDSIVTGALGGIILTYRSSLTITVVVNI
jgi:hypothetical protein